MTCSKFGLLAVGGVNVSFLARMPELIRRLGPVKSSSPSVARKITNGLRAGVAVSHYAELQLCELIWIVSPESKLGYLMNELANNVTLQGKMIVVCDVMRESVKMNTSRVPGARFATLNCVPETGEHLFTAEGHPAVMRELKGLFASDGRKLIQMQPGMKTLYLSGIHITSHLLVPWIIGAVSSFRAAGLSRKQAVRLVHALANEELRAVRAVGARAWNQSDAWHFSKSLQENKETIRLTDQYLSALLSVGAEHLIRLALNHISKRPMVPRLAS